MSKFSADFIAAPARKPQFYFLLNFSKPKSVASFSLIFEGFPLAKYGESVISVLKVNSRNLQSPGLKAGLKFCKTKFECLFLPQLES